jgi:hypothetical protein
MMTMVDRLAVLVVTDDDVVIDGDDVVV